ncbi:DnaJ C-terminal domain-containing protein [Parvibaculum sp.]|uniref:DnaJ C-terminal domain-containing protein n=1 Tax=Parvibaculum sp. TaxID=2024848 RepID=UPI002BAA36E5|nr:DnaJ C-terminal domain-containing protein [Parvibaculum sp.]HUD52418.1 DnaJ C-terminal domain-containing protein [Parvibaculum sp.]
MRDPYEILGLTPTAGAADIKSAYRRLAKRYHPDAQADAGDRPAGAAEQARFQEVTAAYNLLKDAAARARFDEERRRARVRPQRPPSPKERAFEEAAFAKAARRTETIFEATHEAGPEKETSEDLFSELFEGLRSAGKRVFRARGQDRTYRLSISFIEAAIGTRKRVTLDGGKRLDVRVPAGVEQGQQIRLRGQGGDGHGGAEAGDALIEIGIEPHPHFRRDGLDIHLTLPVTLPEAVLGAKVEVPTVSGPVTLTIPEGANTGTRLRLRGKGIAPEGSAGAGDQYVTLELVLPDTQDEPLRDFVRGWAAGQSQNPRQNL